MKGDSARQQPKFGRYGMASVPRIEVEGAKPIFAPGRNDARASMRMNPAVRADQVRIIRANADQPQRYVIEHRSEEIAFAFEVKSKAAVGVLRAAQRRYEFGPVGFAQWT